MYLLLLITHSAYFLSGCGGGFRGCKEGEQPPHMIAGNMLYYSARQILNSFFFNLQLCVSFIRIGVI